LSPWHPGKSSFVSDGVLHSKARLESGQDNGVASQASTLNNDTHFHRADLSVSAEMVSLSNAVSRKAMALDSLVGFTVCFLATFCAEEAALFNRNTTALSAVGWAHPEVPTCKEGKGYIKGCRFLVILLLKCVACSSVFRSQMAPW